MYIYVCVHIIYYAYVYVCMYIPIHITLYKLQTLFEGVHINKYEML